MANKYAVQNKIVALNVNDSQIVKDIDRARRDVESMTIDLQGLLPADAAQRSAKYLGMKISSLLQTNEARASFDKTWRDAGVPILRAISGGSRGMRISQQTINLIIQNLPRSTDTYGTAQRKIGILNRMMDNAEAPVISRNWKRGPATATFGAKPNAKADAYIDSLPLGR